MPRPHVEYVQCQALRWKDLVAGHPRAGARAKTLSADSKTGACSLLIEYPAGWQRRGPQMLACDEEFLVVAGDLVVNGRAFGPRAYGYFPAGLARRGMASQTGAIVLTFFEAEPCPAPKRTKFDRRALVEFCDSDLMPWDTGFDHRLSGSGIGIKFLRKIPNGDRTWLLHKSADRREDLPKRGRLEKHPCVEEFFLLEGQLNWPMGPMKRGAYFWRPPGIVHGPGASLQGYVALFRSKDGPFVTDWQVETRPRPLRDPPYRPVLPLGYPRARGALGGW
ncbi:MAG: DUF4437 domain-containing protein [Alphaproteobacteria bacterium]|nr:DUF4437 domain-containing protein [Alphaproteobacteria bacterium]